MALTPSALSCCAARFTASASSVKVRPATPEGTTMLGVVLVTAPITPTWMPP